MIASKSILTMWMSTWSWDTQPGVDEIFISLEKASEFTGCAKKDVEVKASYPLWPAMLAVLQGAKVTRELPHRS